MKKYWSARTTFPRTIKFNLKMKLSLLLVITFFQLQAFSSGAQKNKLSLHVEDVVVEKVLKKIENLTGYNFFYNVSDIDTNRKVSVKVKDENLDNVLKLVFKNTAIQYKIKDSRIILVKDSLKKASIFPSLQQTISGKVTDVNDVPLTLVTVLLKRSQTTQDDLGNKTNLQVTTTGAYTDFEGKYSIAAKKGDILVFTYIGMKPKEVVVGDNTLIDVVMDQETESLDEVVITGYQKIRKRDDVGASVTVKTEDIKVPGIASVDQLLQGQISGVSVVNPNGLIGTSPRIRIRGTSTLLGNQEPVWVVDGIIQQDKLPFDQTLLNSTSSDGIRDLVGSSVSFLNIEDIEDITVLKDASATAIYGTKAANGVIVIRTKKGKAGKARFNYTTSSTLTGAPSYSDFNLMNSKERIDVSREIYETGLSFQFTPDNLSYEGYLSQLLKKDITQSEFNAAVSKLETTNTDWFDLLYRGSFSQNHSLSVSGGSEQSVYYASIGYNKKEGNTIGNGQETYTVNLNLQSAISEKLDIGVKLSSNFGETKGFYQVSPFNYAYNTSRAISAFNEDGSYNVYKRSNDFTGYNILKEIDNTSNSNTSFNFASTINLDYQISKKLSFQSIFGLTQTQTKGESYATEESYYIGQNFRHNDGSPLPGTPEYRASYLPEGGVLNTSEVTNKAYTLRNGFNYTNRFRDSKDRLNVFGGFEVRSSKYDGLSQTNFGYLHNRGRTFAQIPAIWIPTSGSEIPSPILYRNIPVITDRTSNYMSYFTTATYNFDNRYVLNGTFRSDASNRFGQQTNNRFLPIWSAGLKWNVVEERFFDNRMSWLNQFSLRGSYGFQGNVAENFGPDLVLQFPNVSISPITGEGLVTIKNLGYPDLRWEKTKSLNLGLDISMLKGRVSGSFEYYNKNTTDVLTEIVIPTEYGITTMPINAGNITNKGYEIYVNLVPVSTKNVLWSLNFNTSRNSNDIAKSGGSSLTDWRSASSGNFYSEGSPASTFWGFKFDGLDHVNGRPNFDIPEITGETLEDVTLLMQPLGQLDPKFTGGFGTNLKYKNFTLSTFFNLSIGAHKFLAPLYSNNYNSAPYPTQNLPSALNDRWRSPGDENSTNIPSIPTANMEFVPINNATYSAYQLYDFSSVRVVSADYLRCRNLSLGYSLPSRMLEKTSVNQFRLQATASNLFYIADKRLNGIDPEVSGNSLPIPRTFSLSLNLSF